MGRYPNKACAGVVLVVASTLLLWDCGGHWKPVLPFVLLRVAGEAEELFDPLVLLLRESICLGVEGRGDVLA